MSPLCSVHLWPLYVVLPAFLSGLLALALLPVPLLYPVLPLTLICLCQYGRGQVYNLSVDTSFVLASVSLAGLLRLNSIRSKSQQDIVSSSAGVCSTLLSAGLPLHVCLLLPEQGLWVGDIVAARE